MTSTIPYASLKPPYCSILPRLSAAMSSMRKGLVVKLFYQSEGDAQVRITLEGPYHFTHWQNIAF